MSQNEVIYVHYSYTLPSQHYPLLRKYTTDLVQLKYEFTPLSVSHPDTDFVAFTIAPLARKTREVRGHSFSDLNHASFSLHGYPQTGYSQTKNTFTHNLASFDG
ncbi:hypothetical protein [Paenibacillus amylolyticus]|uniref:hypothetical protein n=1 Tax=Paenibacillus amylolyticus TaxID=1451 RepID=UPI0039AEBF5D